MQAVALDNTAIEIIPRALESFSTGIGLLTVIIAVVYLLGVITRRGFGRKDIDD